MVMKKLIRRISFAIAATIIALTSAHARSTSQQSMSSSRA
jgi:hypothetical protein